MIRNKCINFEISIYMLECRAQSLHFNFPLSLEQKPKWLPVQTGIMWKNGWTGLLMKQRCRHLLYRHGSLHIMRNFPSRVASVHLQPALIIHRLLHNRGWMVKPHDVKPFYFRSLVILDFNTGKPQQENTSEEDEISPLCSSCFEIRTNCATMMCFHVIWGELNWTATLKNDWKSVIFVGLKMRRIHCSRSGQKFQNLNRNGGKRDEEILKDRNAEAGHKDEEQKYHTFN